MKEWDATRHQNTLTLENLEQTSHSDSDQTGMQRQLQQAEFPVFTIDMTS